MLASAMRNVAAAEDLTNEGCQDGGQSAEMDVLTCSNTQCFA